MHLRLQLSLAAIHIVKAHRLSRFAAAPLIHLDQAHSAPYHKETMVNGIYDLMGRYDSGASSAVAANLTK